MLRAAIGFFIIAILAFALGAGGIGGVSMDIGKTLLFVFLVLAVLSFLASLLTGKKVNLIWAPVLMAGLLPLASSHKAQADDSVKTKVENTAGDIKTEAKVDARKVKRTVRDKTGNGSVIKDAKDMGNDVGDKVGNQVDKAKRDAK